MKKIVLAPYIDQTDRWVNGCESISAVMLLQAMGIRIDRIPSSSGTCPMRLLGAGWETLRPGPVAGLSRDPHDHTGYGCYAPASSGR